MKFLLAYLRWSVTEHWRQSKSHFRFAVTFAARADIRACYTVRIKSVWCHQSLRQNILTSSGCLRHTSKTSSVEMQVRPACLIEQLKLVLFVVLRRDLKLLGKGLEVLSECFCLRWRAYVLASFYFCFFGVLAKLRVDLVLGHEISKFKCSSQHGAWTRRTSSAKDATKASVAITPRSTVHGSAGVECQYRRVSRAFSPYLLLPLRANNRRSAWIQRT